MPPSGLHYNPHGLRCISRGEIDAQKRFILSYKFSSPEKFHKPLNSYQNDEHSRTLPELVRARYEDEMLRLQERYQDFFKFPESRFYQSYLRQKEKMERDYKVQERWVDFYRKADIGTARDIFLSRLRATAGTLLFGAGTLSVVSHSSLAPVASSLFYVGSLINFYEAYRNYQQRQKGPNKKEYIQMILEDWYEADPFARYDRAILNDKLQQLDKAKPSQKRRATKYELVHQYRVQHPKER